MSAEEYDPERALITRIAETRDVKPAVNGKVTSTFFADVECREVYEWITGRYDRHGKVPSLALLQSHFPKFEPEETDEDMGILIDSMREKKLYTDLQVSVKKVATEARGAPFDALATFKQEAGDLAVRYSETGTLNLVQSAAQIKKEYLRRKRRKGMLGIPTPWARMNVATRGWRKSAYYAIYGDPGTMKTWLLIYILHFAHKNHDAKPILFTQEMPKEDIMDRWAALRAEVDYEQFQNGELDPKEEKRFFLELERLHEDCEDYLVEELSASGQAGLTEVRAKIAESGANIVGIDGLGDLSSDAEWGSWWEVNKGIKNIAKGEKVPIIGTHHTNRGKRDKPKKYDASKDEDATDIALGEAMFRYTDGLFQVIRTPQHKENEELGMKSKKIREGKPCYFVLDAVPAYSFGQKRSDEDDADFASDEDTL